MDNVETAPSSWMYAADVGLFVFCLLSILCRVKVFASVTGKEMRKTPGVVSFVSHGSTFHHTGTTAPPSLAENECRHASPTSPDFGISPFSTTPSAVEGTLPNAPIHSVDVEDVEESDPLMRLLELPLELRIMVGVNWLSVISNCLTYYLRPSQVLYSFLMCSCDMILYVVDDQSSVVLRRPMPSHGSPHSEVLTEALEKVGSVPLVDERKHFSHTQISVEPNSSVPQNDRVMIRASSGLPPNDGETTLEDAFSQVKDSLLTIPPSVEGGLLVEWWIGFRSGGQRGGFLVLLNVVLVFALVIFHVHHLFFAAGTLAGYLASCGTLYVVGCMLGNMWLLSNWIRSKNSISLPPQVDPSALDITSLPPLGVLLNRWLGLYYALQVIFSFCCSALYFRMLREEGEELYSTHVEFMRWYANTVGQAILDVLRMCLFAMVHYLGRGREGKNWHHRIYCLEGRLLG